MDLKDEDFEREFVMLNVDKDVMGGFYVWMVELGDRERGFEDIFVINWVKDDIFIVIDEFFKMFEFNIVGGGKEVDEYGKEDVVAMKSLVLFCIIEFNFMILYWLVINFLN